VLFLGLSLSVGPSPLEIFQPTPLHIITKTCVALQFVGLETEDRMT